MECHEPCKDDSDQVNGMMALEKWKNRYKCICSGTKCQYCVTAELEHKLDVKRYKPVIVVCERSVCLAFIETFKCLESLTSK